VFVSTYDIITEHRAFVKRNFHFFKKLFFGVFYRTGAEEFGFRPGIVKGEQACKPGFVGNCHLSRRRVAAPLMPPVRTMAGQAGPTYGVASDRVYSAPMLP